jgi:hypothetical protein
MRHSGEDFMGSPSCSLWIFLRIRRMWSLFFLKWNSHAGINALRPKILLPELDVVIEEESGIVIPLHGHSCTRCDVIAFHSR